MKIFCRSGSGSQPHGKVPGRKKPERAQVHKKSKMFFKKRVLQLQKTAKNACFACFARVARVACVHCDIQRMKATICCDFCGFCVFSVVFSCLDLRRTFSKAPSQGVGSRAENYVPIKIFSQNSAKIRKKSRFCCFFACFKLLLLCSPSISYIKLSTVKKLSSSAL